MSLSLADPAKKNVVRNPKLIKILLEGFRVTFVKGKYEISLTVNVPSHQKKTQFSPFL